jgi:hypothetical protein
MAIKISNNTIIDDDRSIINASRAGIGTTNPSNALTVIGDSNITGISTANYFDGFFPGGDKVFDENTTIDNGKVNIALESDIIVESGDTLTVSAGSTIVLNPFDFEKSAVDELLVNKSLTVGFTSSFEAVTSGIASVAANSTSLVGFGTVVPPNIEVGLLVKEIPGVIAAGTTVVSFVSAGTTTGVSTITISPASLNTSVQEDVIFKFGNFGEKESNIILDGEKGDITLKDETGRILNSEGNPILNQTGSILQVVHESLQDGGSRCTTSTTYSDTGFSATITPISNSSRILVMMSLYCDVYQVAGSGSYAGYRIVRDGRTVWNSAADTAGDVSPYGIGMDAAGATSVNMIGQYNIKFIDDPEGSLNPLTYKVQFAVYSGQLCLSYNDDTDPRSDIILMEISK